MELLLPLITIVILVYSAILHEIAHGLVAERLGDPTARIMGRLTLDPRPHIDPVLSVLLPLVLILGGSPVVFGAAKPVPVDPFNLKDGRKDMALVSLAGPATNFLLAIIGSLLARFLFPGASLGFILGNGILGYIIGTIIYLNLILGIFNLIPIPPLDGSKVVALILPEKEANTYLSIGMVGIFIIFFLLMFPIGGFSLGSFIGNLLLFSEHLLGL